MGKAHLVPDETVAHRALLTLVGQPVLVVVQLTLVTLITNKPTATRTCPVVMALHQGRAHGIAITCYRWEIDIGGERSNDSPSLEIGI